MRKYAAAYTMALQEALQLRWSLAADRVRGLALVLSLYFLWSTLLASRESFLGYSREQMITYVLGMSLLRALILSGKGWELIHEIASGKLSAWLLRPANYFAMQFSRELAHKTLLVGSAVFEIAVLVALFGAPLYAPKAFVVWPLFCAATAMSLLLYYQLALLVCSSAFWTAESIGPLFSFEIFLQFAAGAFFPLDVLPPFVQSALKLTPFPYLVFFPLEIFLERAQDVAFGFGVQLAWALVLGALVSKVWKIGLKDYGAEGG